MDNSHSLLAVVEKLPYHLRTRWLKENHSIKIKEKRNCRLTDLVNFISLAAEEASDPVFGKAVLTGIKKKTGSFAIVAGPTTPKVTEQCIKCKGNHFVTQCHSFKSLKIKDRHTLIQSKGLCLNCLKPGHYSRECPSTIRCTVDGCGKKHSKFLHFPTRNLSQSDQVVPGVPQPSNQGMPAVVPQISNFANSSEGKLALPIVPARVRSPNSDTYVDTYAMLDTGTNATYCTEELFKRLGATGNKRHIELTTISQERLQIETTVTTLLVSDVQDSKNPLKVPEVTVRPGLNIDLSGLANKGELRHWPHLSNLEIPEIRDVNKVHLLIGQDCADLLMPQEVRKGRPGEPYAVLTPLGWAINGPVNQSSHSARSSHFVQQRTELTGDLEKLWALEGANSEEVGMSVNDHKTLQIWDESKEIVDGHYSLDIPFKAKEPNLYDNRIMAERRLHSLRKRLEKDSSLKSKYTTEIHQLLEKGYAEQVPSEELKRDDGKVWYLPHHPVLNPKKPDKCRIVFDCAATHKGTSLNDHVHQGPDLTNKLIGVLLRFRQEPVAFMADIESMFHQVKVNVKDRDVLRFLWWDNSGLIIPYRMTSHLFGGVWSPSCANYALKMVVKDNEGTGNQLAMETINNNFYVDDCLKSLADVNTAIAVAEEVKRLLAEKGFHLTKWVSNSLDFMKTIPKEDWGKSFGTQDLSGEKLPTERALGLLWNVGQDHFEFDAQIEDKPKTKRGVLSALSTIFDPMGYVSPCVLKARLLFQQLCRLNKGWDEGLTARLENQWSDWLSQLQYLNTFRIPRCLNPLDVKFKAAQLHHFSDASECAYGAISYLRLTTEDATHVGILMAKSRLAPLKGSTVPRLELAGAVEAMRLDKLLRQELELTLEESVFWTDSTIVLWYLQNEGKRFQTYVANRVSRILAHTKPVQWRYVPTSQNPADDASRGMTAEELVSSSRWVHGPDFLKLSHSQWPQQPAFKCTELEKIAEVKRNPVVYSTKSDVDSTNTLLNYYSSWFKLKKAIAWMLRLKQILRKKPTTSGPLSARELQASELAIVKYVQCSLSNTDTRPQLAKLRPVKSKAGLLRVGGRLNSADLDDDAKHQLILPHKHHVSRLIVEDCHMVTGHAGVERVLAETPQRYWILKGRKLVKVIVSQCIPCRKSRGKTEVQLMADLPKERVTPYEPPFTCVGVDYFGPFNVKRGRSEVKRYGCIFTCLAIRAIHIEVAHSLDTDSFINALERFIARRGAPRMIRSDNGTNFTGARAELRRALLQWNQGKIHNFLLKREIDWKFNPPGASHMGGVWERQIRSVRSVLAGIMKQQTMDDENLVTVLTVAEGIVNNRPITKLSDDVQDERPLSPSHLLMLRGGPTLPPGQFEAKDQYRKRWKQVQYLADIFWSRWLSEYLPALQERQKWLKLTSNLKPGDLVMVCQDHTPRNQWPLGLVTGTRAGNDNIVRAVEVKTAHGIFERPITKICLLEASGEDQ
ncbi:uncharacterized protein LOC106168462 [Lingula anatina]|uniref:Uncharacterized protein LOC106168462 n=1 Tax=Lingula anatina TaxID=7574 RepID=A0A1S3IZI0_LINAN|nr:uncharacterized protein LOC106168462 [Lingula anatina]|eukprot:XP_013402959.1 uncharacterized protein LOC106168462 [Lingula anatina]